MAKQTSHAKQVLADLLAAGFTRSQLKVRNPADRAGNIPDDFTVLIHAPVETVLERKAAILAAGINMLVVKLNGKESYIITTATANYPGDYHEMNLNAVAEQEA